MAKEGKKAVVPKLRFPVFQQGWKEHSFGEFLTESRIPGSDGSIAKKLTVKLWGNGVLGKNETVKGSVNTQYYKRKAGQFIYSKLDFLNQAFGIVPDNLDGYESTVDLPCFDLDERIHPRFLLEYVKRADFYERFGEIADGGRKAKRIQVETFLSFPLAIPAKFSEQQKIADCLSSLDELIATQGRKVEALRTYKRGLMQQLFPREGETLPRLRFPEFRDAPEWEEVPLGDLFDTSSGGTPDRTKREYWNGDIPWITTSLVDFNFITRANEFISEAGLDNSSAKVFPEGTVLIAMYGQGITRGKVAMLGIPAATNQACAAILPNDEVDSGFTFVSLCGRYEEMRRLSNNGGQENLSQALIRALPFRYPKDVEEQAKIVECFSEIDALIVGEGGKLDALKLHKDGLMRQLFPSVEDTK